MGYLFELAAELGNTPSGVVGLATVFDGATWILSDGTTVKCHFKPCSSNVWVGPDGNTWCRIAPNGVSLTGASRTVTNNAMLMELAQRMYESLKDCEGFRFALIGWEVAESVEVAEILDAKFELNKLPIGLVVSKDIWARMGSPPTFIMFGNNNFWKPMETCDYHDLVKLFQD